MRASVEERGEGRRERSREGVVKGSERVKFGPSNSCNGFKSWIYYICPRTITK